MFKNCRAKVPVGLRGVSIVTGIVHRLTYPDKSDLDRHFEVIYEFKGRKMKVLVDGRKSEEGVDV